MFFTSCRRKLLCSLMFGTAWLPVQAQDAPAGAGSGDASPTEEESGGDGFDGQSIVVTGVPLRGSVIGNVPPEIRLDAEDVGALGASNIGEAIDILTPETGADPQQGPIVLVNGRRIADRREIRRYPPEAIERIDILPPEVALSYGYPVDARVMNIVLRESFGSVVVEAEQGFATRGGVSRSDVELSYTRIAGESRFNAGLDYRHESALLESERDLVPRSSGDPFDPTGNVTAPIAGGELDPALSALAGFPVTVAGVPVAARDGPAALADFLALAGMPNVSNLGAFRTLRPETDQLEIDLSYRRPVGEKVTATISAGLETGRRRSLLGLPSATVTIPAGNPFSPFAGDVLLYRYLDEYGPLTRRVSSRNARLAVTLEGELARWRWNFSGEYRDTRSITRTEAGPGLAGVQGALVTGDPALNPFAPIPAGRLTSPPPDRVRSSNRTLGARLNVNGSPLSLPAGPVNTTLRTDFSLSDFDGRTERAGSVTGRSFSRDQAGVQASLDIPIASRRRDVLAPLGDLSANLALELARQSRVGTLTTVTYGLRWEPIPHLDLSANVVETNLAPTAQQLGDPVLATPNVSVVDFVTGDSVEITRIEGGNPGLQAPGRRTVSLRAQFVPSDEPRVQLYAEYKTTQVSDPIYAFPTATAAIESAFPDRFVRGTDGRLLRIDSRPVNFARSRQAELEWGPGLMVRWGVPQGGGERPSILPRGEGRGGRVMLRLIHSIQLEDTLLVRPGLPEIDQLEGSSSGRGQPRHRLRLFGLVGWNGWSARIQGEWQGRATTERGGGERLIFAPRAGIDADFGLELDERHGAVRRWRWLDGVRLSLEIDNLLDARQRVRDANGITPLAYQPALLDPLGRTVTFGLRKRF